MGEVRLRVQGPADPQIVWDRYADPTLWATWSPYIRGVTYPHDRIRSGARGQVHGPLGLRVPFTVDAVDEEDLTWSWTVRLRCAQRDVVTVGLDHGVEPCGRGAATWLHLRGAWPVVVGYAPIARCALSRLLRM